MKTEAAVVEFAVLVCVSLACVSCRKGEERADLELPASERKIEYAELPDYFRLEAYRDAIVTDMPLQASIREMTTVEYEVRTEFPPSDILERIYERLTALGWKEQGHSLVSPDRLAGESRGWQPLVGPGPNAVLWDSWWVKDECAINTSIMVESPDSGGERFTRATLSHYEGPQTVELIGMYYERQDAARASEAATDQKSDSE